MNLPIWQEAAELVKKEYGSIDILVHSLANGPEVASLYFFTFVFAHARAWHRTQYFCSTFTKKSPNFMLEGYKTFAGNLKKWVSCCNFSIQLLLCFFT